MADDQHPIAGIERPPSHTVLYIEDDDANLRLVERIFARRENIELISADHGLAGSELARARRPVLVLLDLGLPDVSGEIVLERLRGDPATAAIPVVIVSGDATDQRVQRLLDSGAS